MQKAKRNSSQYLYGLLVIIALVSALFIWSQMINAAQALSVASNTAIGVEQVPTLHDDYVRLVGSDGSTQVVTINDDAMRCMELTPTSSSDYHRVHLSEGTTIIVTSTELDTLCGQAADNPVLELVQTAFDDQYRAILANGTTVVLD